ncbi:hypothetical protein EBU71_04475 [bacterium]|nr:hypothetical protein [Candidatus Elulimicrobium humile]
MNIKDLEKPITSKMLNESLAQKFGYSLNLSKFTMEQLQDARNKLRTVQSQFESNNSYDSVLEDHKYQKNKMFLDVINQEIAEREEKGEEKKDEKKKHKVKNIKEYFSAIRRLRTHKLPEQWKVNARQRLMLERDADEEVVSELIIRYDLDETTAKGVVRDLRLTEGEEEKAELIMAAKDMTDRITGWLEDVASMKSEAMLDLLDSIRDEMGSDVSASFEQTVRPALDEIYLALEKNRQLLAQATSVLTGQEAPGGAGLGMGGGMGAPGGMGPPEMGGADDMEAELGGEEPAEPAGRAMREAAYSRRLASMLASKKK